MERPIVDEVVPEIFVRDAGLLDENRTRPVNGAGWREPDASMPVRAWPDGQIGARTAACLAEVDYLSDPGGEQRLRDPRHRAAIGAAIADAIQDHLGAAPTGASTGAMARNEGRGPVDRFGRSVAQAAGVLDDLVDTIRDAVDPIANIFHRVVDTNKAVATALTPPARYYDKVRAYAAVNADDGAWLTMGLARDPRFWQGGWILDIQTGAAAMTLDRDVFFRDSLSIGTFAHELVHVGQYAILGPTDFLVSYFGLSAATIAWRLVRGEPLEVMRSSPHENQAYEIGRRFEAWLAANP